MISTAMPECSLPALRSDIDERGFAIVRQVIPSEVIANLITAIPREPAHAAVRRRRGATYAVRDLLRSIPAAKAVAAAPSLRALVEAIIGPEARVTRAILFDKNASANWAVPWHQDTTIAVRERRDAPGFGPWSVKAGIVHVQPPAAVLEQMLTARVHLDDCDASSGALLVLPGSHREGILNDLAVDAWQHRMPASTCAARAGDVLLMRPLVLHSSGRAENPLHRRVIHLEFAACNLPGGLQWCEE